MVTILRMIETSGVLALMYFGALTLWAGDNQNIAVAAHLVADRPTFDTIAPRRAVDDVNIGGERALPGALPVRSRGAPGEQQEWKQAFHGAENLRHFVQQNKE